MLLELPPDPSLKDLQLPFEHRYCSRRTTWVFYARIFEKLVEFFGPDRKPRDIFRSDVKAYVEYLRKKGNKDSSINVKIQVGASFYNFLNELELIEVGYNPFKEAAPKRIRVYPR